MKLKLAKATCGMEGALEEQLHHIAEAGYQAVEMRIPDDLSPADLRSRLRETGLGLIAMVFTDGDDHLASLRSQVETALPHEPLFINSHSARDCWTFDQQRAFFAGAVEIEGRAGIPINHETHRGRAFFNPWSTEAMLKEFPDLHITADFSHFVCVCERLLSSDPALASALELCIARSRHIHGRVGYEEGPQVSDPRAPEWAAHVEAHETWWKAIAHARFAAGAEYLTFDPEFGPPNYMQTLPYSRQPAANLWEVCLYMATRFRQQFEEMFPAKG
jgi:sugar phosphate isomerase/epimerase